MAVTKRLRFEILRRDNHACRYCGATAPDVKLTVDHVVPSALGGTDDPSNLVAACAGCNSGKSSSSPDATLVADVSADTLRWARAMESAAAAMLADLGHREEVQGAFLAKWNSWATGPDKVHIPLPGNWAATIDRFIAAGLPLPLLLECVDIAMGANKIRSENLFRYMCGVAWRRITALQEVAGKAVAGDEASDPEEAGALPSAGIHYPLLDVLDESFLDELLKVLSVESSTRRLASEAMHEAAWAGNTKWLDAGLLEADYDTAVAAAREAARAAALPFLGKIAARLDRLGVVHGQD